MQLSIKNLTKKYGSKIALNNLTLELNHGIYALLGPNGAGKTTMINILVGVMQATSGEILYKGKPIFSCQEEYLSQIGYLPQNPSFYKNFTAQEFLEYMCVLKDIPKLEIKQKVAQLLESVNLTEVSNKKIASFSGGMRQRIGIAQALINDPGLLILDEPTAGLDPKERMRFRNVLSKLSKDRIIIFATHIVSDIEYLADWIILLKQGNLVSLQKPDALLDDIKSKTWNTNISEEELEHYMLSYKVSNISYQNGGYQLHLISNDKPCENATYATPTLNDVYLDCFGEEDV